MSSYLDKTGLERFWAAIKSKFAPKNQGVQYIRGTWTAATGTWTGVSKDSELYDGKQIILYMPFGGSGNATLNLTLANGTTTGAKNVYFEGTTRFTTHKGQNSQLPLIYHSGLKLSNGTTYEGWWYLANRDTTNTAATTAPGKVASDSAVGTSTNYARQDHTHGIDLVTGDANGQIKIAGTNVSVKGWNDAATYDVQTTLANDTKLPTGAAVTTALNKYLPLSGGTLTNTDNVFFTANASTVIKPTYNSILASPVAKYLYHDIFAFCKAAVPTYETSSNGSSWTTATLNKNLFAQKATWGGINILTSSIKGSRWTWPSSAGFAYSSGYWLMIDVNYSAKTIPFKVLLQSIDSSGNISQTLCNTADISANQQPVWIRVDGSSQNSLRLTITGSSSDTSATVRISSIRLLSLRQGDQGKGPEFEYPYTWDGDQNVTFPATVTATNFAGKINNHTVNADVPSGAKFTDTTYSSKAAASGGTDVSLVTTGQKYTWNQKTSNTGTVTSVATGAGLTGGTITGSGTLKANLASETKSSLASTAMGSTASRQYAVGLDKDGHLSVNIPWTDNNTTYTAATAAPGKIASSSSQGTSTNYARQDHTHGINLATGDANGQVKIAGTNVSVKGWNNAATYDVQTTVANDAKLPTGAAVKSFVEGKGYVTTDTKNTTGSTDTSSKIFLIGATSQATNPQTYSDNEIYATSGVLTTKSVQVGGTAATMQYNSTTDAIDFIFS